MLFKLKCAAAFALCLCAFVGCKAQESASEATVNGDEPKVVQVAEVQVADHPITKSLMYFGDEVEKRTDGRVRVEVCPAGVLGSESDTISMVRDGSLDMTRASSITMSELQDELTVISLPYMFESDDHMWRVIESDIGDKLLTGFDDCVGLCWIENGVRCFYSTSPINSPDDMRGKVFRVPGTAIMDALISSYGATPVTIEFSKIYNSVADGSIDGAENDIVSYESLAHDVVAKYFTKNNHIYSPGMLIASMSLKEKLGEDDYNILVQCAKDTEQKSRDNWFEAEVEAEEKLAENGAIIIEPTEENMAKFRAAADVLYDGYEDYSDTIKQIKAMN